jgi:hypothetical protein
MSFPGLAEFPKHFLFEKETQASIAQINSAPKLLSNKVSAKKVA